MVDKDDRVDMIGLGFFKAFDLATDDILVKKFILCGINRTHIRWLKN